MTHIVEKLMSISRTEFAASLAALDATATLDASGQALIKHAGKAVHIAFEKLPDRRLGGLLAMPQARVRIALGGATADEAADFLRRFAIAFQRGGG